MKLSKPDPTNRMVGKTILITGGTGGIGKATAIGLVSMGARVGIVGRDRRRAEGAANDIAAWAEREDAVDVFVADMSGQAEIHLLAGEVLDTYPRLDVLINNVGGYWAHRHVTADGLERTFAVNYLAPFLLTNLLLARLKSSTPSRVVTVASNAARGHLDFDDLQGEREYSGGHAYGQAKLATILFSYELARRLEGSGVTANAVFPGVVRTNFGAEDPTKAMKLVLPLFLPFMKTPAKGAKTSIHVASAPELERVSGLYFANSQPRKSAKHSYDEATADRLWRVSTELVQLAVVPSSLDAHLPESSLM